MFSPMFYHVHVKCRKHIDYYKHQRKSLFKIITENSLLTKGE